ncbi:uncharacterized protein LOC115757331 [Rhodamnia argentea]|uniref:Uncharacterized protein LOC115757331 n=1 Tax=Rhodamnia argentea TaxID=178133 RepID=A0A8B8R4G6_9MYRT|nr:uncharacterized protein LOC115757331 [Rhodamnia argentea]
MALSAKNKMGFVDGTISRSATTDSSYEAWNRVNNMVLSWLLNSIHCDLAASVLYADFTVAVWKDLYDRFSPSNGPRIFALERAMATLQQNNDSVTKYFNTLKAYWDELGTLVPIPSCTCGAYNTFSTHYQNRQLMQFLMGLNDVYAPIRSQILLQDPLPSLGRAYSLILQDESQRLLQSSNAMVEGFALLTMPTLCDTFARSINAVTKPRSAEQRQRSKERCTYCHIVGHTWDVCYKLNGYPPHYRAARCSQPRRDTVATPMSTTSSATLAVNLFTTEQY